jgi:hypothetical protein
MFFVRASLPRVRACLPFLHDPSRKGCERLPFALDRSTEDRERSIVADDTLSVDPERLPFARDLPPEDRERSIVADDTLSEDPQRLPVERDQMATDIDRALSTLDRMARNGDRSPSMRGRLREASQHIVSRDPRRDPGGPSHP